MTQAFKKVVLILAIGFPIAVCSYFIFYWVQTQPVGVSQEIIDLETSTLPKRNKQVIAFIESEGKKLAASYDDVVCTEFMIDVIENFTALSQEEKHFARVITQEKIEKLVDEESAIVRGVQTALTLNNKGIKIDNVGEVKPGDFVQFWNEFNNTAYGHCGIVLSVQPGEALTVYSSHPFTDGYGKQKFWWPDKIYFVRLK